MRRWLAPQPSTTVLLYRAMGDELCLDPLAADPTLAHHDWATTRTPVSGPLTVHPWQGPLERHRFGFDQPADGAPQCDPARIGVVLVPGLLFDRLGGRLGHGRGYYDRLLGALPNVDARVAIVIEDLLVARLPTEPHDVAMSHIATERGFHGPFRMVL